MNRSNIDLWGWLSGQSKAEPEKLEGPGLAVVDVRDVSALLRKLSNGN
jgi:hypothetical protein